MDTLPSASDMNYESIKSERYLESAYNSITSLRTVRSGFRIKKMYLAAASCLFLGLTVGLVTGYTAPATYDMLNRASSRVKPTDLEVSWIGSILAIGLMVGNVLAGPLIEKIGRKDVMVFNIIPAACGWLMIFHGKSALMIILGRFICGISIGVLFIGIPTYCVEISTPEVRGLMGSGYHGFLVIGHLLSVTIGSYISWDYLALNGAVFSTLGVICFSFMPESPRWLIAKGKLVEAISVLKTLHGPNFDADKECIAIYNDLRNKPELSLKELRNPTIYKPTIISIVIFSFSQFCGMMVIFSFSSDIFKISKDFIDPKKATIVLAVVQVIATLTSNFTVDKAGRKILLIISGIWMALAMAVLGAYYYVLEQGNDFSNYNWLPLVSLMVYVTAYSLGYGPVSVLLTAELLPTRARSTMTGVAGLSNGISAFIIIQTFSSLRQAIHSYGAFWLYSCFSVLGVIFTIIFVPETKGKKLEDAENIFRDKKEDPQNTGLSIIN